MYFALDDSDVRWHASDAQKGRRYRCHVCNNEMVLKQGERVTYHFAHKSQILCDPYYKENKSEWHRKMQERFPKDTREQGVWNRDHSKVRIADILIPTNRKVRVFEFQHSPISQHEFMERTSFYVDCGYDVIWLFNLAEMDSPKRIYTQNCSDNVTFRYFNWPGRDRISLFDGSTIWSYLGGLHCNKLDDSRRVSVIMYIDAVHAHKVEWLDTYGKGRRRMTWRWEEDYPHMSERLYVLPEFNDDGFFEIGMDDNLKLFSARCLTQREFDDYIQIIINEYEKNKSN